MSWLRDFKAKAVLGFAMVIAATVAALVIALVLDRRASKEREQLLAGFYDNELVASRIELNAERMVAASRGYLLTGDLRTLENVEKAEGEFDSAIRQLERTRIPPGMPEHLALIKRSAAEYRSAFDQLVAEAHAAPSRKAMSQAVEAQLLPRRAELARHVQALVTHMDQLLAEGHASAGASASLQLRILLGIGGAGVLLALLLAWMAARRLDVLYAGESDAKRRAERAVQAREELLRVVAHDLRSPLNAMLLKAALIRGGTEDERARKSAEEIGRIATRMEYLIKSLLDATSIEAGQFTIARERCVVAEVLSSALEMFGSLAGQKSICLKRKIDRADLVVWGDRERIIQVLSNLLSNAVKFTPEGGEIEVRVHQAAPYVRFEVRDTGPGIARDHVPRVFDRYWKAEAGGRMGTGLGLYIAKGIVDAHGGQIWIDAERRQGCSFLFEIPMATKETAGPAPSPARPEQHPSRAG